METDLQIAWEKTTWNVEESLLALLRPLRHLSVYDDASPSLRVHVKRLQGSPPGVVHMQIEERQTYHRLERSWSRWNKEERRIEASFLSIDLLTLHELGRPLHAQLSLWHNFVGKPLIHAGLVRWNGRGVLIGGESGRGKSTLTRLIAEAGGEFISDDLTSICKLGNTFRGHGLYASSYNSRGVGKAPRYSGEEKHLEIVSEGQLKVAVESRIDMLVLPHPKRVGPLKPSVALFDLAPGSILTGCLAPGSSALESLAELVRSIPCYSLSWDEDWRRVLETMDKQPPRQADQKPVERPRR